MMTPDNTKQIREKAENYNPNGYKIQCGYKYRVYIQQYGGNTFYKIQVVKTDTRTNTKLTAYKSVAFRNKMLDVSQITDGCFIIPKKLFEDFYFKANDKFNPIWSVVITDWEVIKSDEQERNEALQEFNNVLDFEDDLPF